MVLQIRQLAVFTSVIQPQSRESFDNEDIEVVREVLK